MPEVRIVHSLYLTGKSTMAFLTDQQWRKGRRKAYLNPGTQLGPRGPFLESPDN